MSEWPKKMAASDFAKRWFVSRTKESVINDVKSGHLPGVQDGAQWFVWVNADLSPAHGYRGPVTRTETPGAILAQEIIARRSQMKVIQGSK